MRIGGTRLKLAACDTQNAFLLSLFWKHCIFSKEIRKIIMRGSALKDSQKPGFPPLRPTTSSPCRRKHTSKNGCRMPELHKYHAKCVAIDASVTSPSPSLPTSSATTATLPFPPKQVLRFLQEQHLSTMIQRQSLRYFYPTAARTVSPKALRQLLLHGLRAARRLRHARTIPLDSIVVVIARFGSTTKSRSQNSPPIFDRHSA